MGWPDVQGKAGENSINAGVPTETATLGMRSREVGSPLSSVLHTLNR